MLCLIYFWYSVSIPRISSFMINHIILPLEWNFCPKVFQIYGRITFLGLVGTPHLFLPMEFWVIWVCSGVSSFSSGSNLYYLYFDTSSSHSASITLFLPSSCHIMGVLVPAFGGVFLHVQSLSLGLITRQFYYWCLVGVLSVELDPVWRLFWHNVFPLFLSLLYSSMLSDILVSGSSGFSYIVIDSVSVLLNLLLFILFIFPWCWYHSTFIWLLFCLYGIPCPPECSVSKTCIFLFLFYSLPVLSLNSLLNNYVKMVPPMFSCP